MSHPLSPAEAMTSGSPPLTAMLNLEEAADPIMDEPPFEPEQKEELLTIVVEIGDGREESITVYEGDKAEVLAAEFAERHRLDAKMQEKLAAHIQQNIDQALIDIALEEDEKGQVEDQADGPEEKVEEAKVDYEFERWQIEMEKNLKESLQVGPAINSNSKKMAAGMALTSMPVHQRLHMQAMNKQKALKHSQEPFLVEAANALESKSMSNNMKPSNSDRNSLNYGYRLYQKGIKKKEERDREIKEARKEKEIKEQQQYTFKPEIDSNSKQLLKDLYREKPEDRLLMLGQVTQGKKEQQRTVLAIEDKLKCTFHPEVNKKSERMASERSKNLSVEVGEKQASVLMENKFEFLFEDAKRRYQHQEILKGIVPDTECTFHPNIQQSQRLYTSIGGVSDKLLAGKIPVKAKPVVGPVSEGIDQKTGQALFKPKICRPPKNDRNIASLPIGDYLYAQNKRKEELLNKKKIEEVNKSKTNCNSSYVREESKQIIEGKKWDIFSEIFTILDKDGDGIITAKSVNISGLPTEVLELYTPLFCEMEELDQGLNLEEFIEASGRLYDSLALPEKNALLNYKKRVKRPMSSDHMFQPMINKKSREMAQKSKFAGLGIADRHLLKQKMTQMKIAEQQKRQEMSQLESCTFHPRIIYKDKLVPNTTDLM